jgi:hypothetical protein
VQCPSCGRHYRLSSAPGLLCERCWHNSRHARLFTLRPRRRLADVRPHADPRPASERATTVVVTEPARIVFLPLADADEPEVA